MARTNWIVCAGGSKTWIYCNMVFSATKISCLLAFEKGQVLQIYAISRIWRSMQGGLVWADGWFAIEVSSRCWSAWRATQYTSACYHCARRFGTMECCTDERNWSTTIDVCQGCLVWQWDHGARVLPGGTISRSLSCQELSLLHWIWTEWWDSSFGWSWRMCFTHSAVCDWVSLSTWGRGGW